MPDLRDHVHRIGEQQFRVGSRGGAGGGGELFADRAGRAVGGLRRDLTGQ